MDVLSRGIQYMTDHHLLQPIQGPRNWQSPSHLIYANDVLILCTGTKEHLKNSVFLLNLFTEASGLKINHNKCKFYSSLIPCAKRDMINSLVGFSGSTDEFNYWGSYFQRQASFEASERYYRHGQSKIEWVA
ncbi:hypothetical protein Fmac_025032 [Flemingia macrophylla]|uniref:Reverse transcriptase domain-containing protein n=1 Tax=Flemingia macrophylla TaxID=520843 RepID=A0ABD1LR17_9FABA